MSSRHNHSHGVPAGGHRRPLVIVLGTCTTILPPASTPPPPENGQIPILEEQEAPAQAATAGGPEECCAEASCSGGPVERAAGWHAAAKAARILSWVSLVWMVGEGTLGLLAGAASESISLIGWALGSAIEGLASVIVIWRFTGARTLSETAEASARKAVAVSFFLLAPYIAAESVRDLATGHQAEVSVLGIVVTSASLLVMPLLGVAKQRLGTRLESGATAGEGVQNLLCAAQAAAVLAGLAATATLGWWWIDPLIGLGLAAVAVHEGREAWNGEDCC